MPTRPRRKRASASSPMRVMSVPATVMRPALGRSSPAATISSEDLPEPDGPVSATLWPAGTPRETPFRISTGPASAFQRQADIQLKRWQMARAGDGSWPI